MLPAACSLDSMSVCDAWSLKSDRANLRRVAILPYFDTHSMDWVDGEDLKIKFTYMVFKCIRNVFAVTQLSEFNHRHCNYSLHRAKFKNNNVMRYIQECLIALFWQLQSLNTVKRDKNLNLNISSSCLFSSYSQSKWLSKTTESKQSMKCCLEWKYLSFLYIENYILIIHNIAKCHY